MSQTRRRGQKAIEHPPGHTAAHETHRRFVLTYWISEASHFKGMPKRAVDGGQIYISFSLKDYWSRCGNGQWNHWETEGTLLSPLQVPKCTFPIVSSLSYSGLLFHECCFIAWLLWDQYLLKQSLLIPNRCDFQCSWFHLCCLLDFYLSKICWDVDLQYKYLLSVVTQHGICSGRLSLSLSDDSLLKDLPSAIVLTSATGRKRTY